MKLQYINKGYDPAVPLSTLHVHPQNARIGNFSVIRESIETNGFYGALICQESTRFILKGNQTFAVAKAEKIKVLPVIWIECDDETALRILAIDNRSGDLASYDDQRLVELVQEIANSTEGLAGSGFTSDDLDAMIASLGDGLLDLEPSALPEDEDTAPIADDPHDRQSETTSKLVFNTHAIPMTNEESAALEKLFKEYSDRTGSHYGFVRYLLDL